MTSTRKRRANRANSLRSTGPKTAAGRSKSARNAFRHGLGIPVLSDPRLCAEADALAAELLGDADREFAELAHHIAEAETDLLRIRRERTARLNELTRKPLPTSETGHTRPTQDALVNLPQRICRLAVLDRYERRAFSRRKFAIRAFDAARAEAR
jgi:hypothetical protein